MSKSKVYGLEQAQQTRTVKMNGILALRGSCAGLWPRGAASAMAHVAVIAAQFRVQYRLKLPDAVQMASALEVGATALVTHDRDFS